MGAAGLAVVASATPQLMGRGDLFTLGEELRTLFWKKMQSSKELVLENVHKYVSEVPAVSVSRE